MQIEDKAPRNRLITATLIAAVCIQQLVHARDGGPGPVRPLSDAFEPEDIPLLEACCAQLEGKTERQKNPHPKGSFAHAGLVLRASRWMDRLLRQAGPDRHCFRDGSSSKP